MQQKLVFFDIDGTLYDDKKQLPESAREAILQLQKNGHIAAIATGRSPIMFQELRDQLDIHSYVSMNGQYVVHNDEVVFKNPLDKSRLRAFMQEVEAEKGPFMFLDQENMVSRIDAHPRYDKALATLDLPYPYRYDPEYFKSRDVLQGLLFAKENEYTDILERYSDDFHFIQWHDVCMDVLPKEGSKALGLRHLIHVLDFDIKDTIAFGDGPNDHEMLREVGVGVAMGNSSDALKADADVVTDDVHADGIQIGLQKLGLI